MASRGVGGAYDELGRERRLERVGDFVGVLADTALARPYRLEGLAQALLAPVSRRGAWRRSIHHSEPRLFARLPSVCGVCAAVGLRCMAGARRPRRAEAIALVFLGRGQEIGLEGGELEGGIRTGVPRQRGHHGDGRTRRRRGVSCMYSLRHEERKRECR